MDFTIETKALQKALGRAMAVSKGSPDDGADKVQLLARADNVSVTLNSTTLASSSNLTASTKAVGGRVADVAELMKFARGMSGEYTRIKVEKNGKLLMESGRASAKIPSLSTEDFPGAPVMDPRSAARMPTAKFLAAMKSVAASVSRLPKFGLNGVYVDRSAVGAMFVASDGARLAAFTVPFGGEVAFPQRSVIPLRAVQALAAAAFTGDEVTLEFDLGAGRVVSGSESIWFRLIDGEFPDYRSIVPTRMQRHVVKIDERFAVAVKRLLAVQASAPGVFAFEDGEVTMTRTGTEDSVSDVVSVDYTGRVTVGLNPSFLLEAIEAVGGEAVTLDFGTNLSPVLVYSNDVDYCVVMPARFE